MRGSVVTLLAFTLLTSGYGTGQEPGKKSDNERKQRFTISKETTYVTGPVDKDGYIDYETALNERMGRGVTPANNANVLLWRAFGPHPEGATMPGAFFHWMGVTPPPDDGDYFIDLFTYIRKNLNLDPTKNIDKIYEQVDRARTRPWKAKEYAYLAAWLKVNERPLALVLAATKRSEYYSPLVTKKADNGPTTLISALLPGVQKCRAFAEALSVRAMLNLGEDRADAAWQDVLALHRLGRLMTRGGTLIEKLVGIAIDAIASETDQAFLEHKAFDAKRLKSCLRDLESLPPMPSIADGVELTERVVTLQMMSLIDRYGIRTLEAIAGAGALGNLSEEKAKKLLENMNWDPALRSANRWYDRLVAAMRMPARAGRDSELDKVEKDLRSLKDKLPNSPDLAKALAGEGKIDPEASGKAIGDLLILLLLPATRKVQTAYDRIGQTHQNLHVAFALSAYQREEGHYPEKLDALMPKYLEKIPEDIFSGQALVYRRQDNGYLLYSFGVNGKDDQGRSYDDDPPGDDLRVRLPLPKLKAR